MQTLLQIHHHFFIHSFLFTFADKLHRMGIWNIAAKISRTIDSRNLRSLWLILTSISVLGVADLPYAPVFTLPVWAMWIEMVFVAAFKSALLTIVIALCRRLWLRITAFIFTGIYAILCIVNAVSYFFYGFGITHRLTTVVMQTTMRETTEFLPSVIENLLTFKVLCAVVIFVTATILLAWLIRKMSGKSFMVLFAMVSICGAGVTAYYLCTLQKARASFLVFGRTARYAMATYHDNKMIEEITGSLKPLPYADKVNSAHSAATLVLVIGESASRAHHSLYGYVLPTTPGLDALRDSLYVFTDAIGSSFTTAGNMERILSLKIDDAVAGDAASYPLLLDIFTEAGYKTFWLSNQEKSGVFCNISGVMVSRADVVNYIGNISSEENLMRTFDAALLPVASEALADSAAYKFIGLHLMGSHTEYRERYPEEFKYFTADDILAHAPRPWLTESKAEKVAEYDNSIRYTDSILSELIDKIAKLSDPAVLVYLADHGEDVYDDRDFRGRDTRFVEIPMIIYVNSAYRVANPEIVTRLKESCDTPISTASIVFPLMNLSGTTYPLYDATNDFLSPSYVVRPRYVDEEIWPYEHTFPNREKHP